MRSLKTSMTLSGATLLLTIAPSAFADERGNGGDVVVCRDGSDAITSIELLDYYEGRQIPGTLSPDLRGADEFAMAQDVIDRLTIVDPTRRAHYQNWLATFQQEALFLPGVVLVDISDSEHLHFPRGCNVEQIAIHQEPHDGEPRYTVSADLWNALDQGGRAGLLLHELIYREAVTTLGHRDSRNVRRLARFLASSPARTMTLSQYVVKTAEYQMIGGDLTGPDLLQQGRQWDFTLPDCFSNGLIVDSFGMVGSFECGDGANKHQTIRRYSPNGELAWSHEVTEFDQLVGNAAGESFYTTNDGKVGKLDPQGKPRWLTTVDLHHRFWAPIPDKTGGIFLTSFYSNCARVDSDGSIAWSMPCSVPIATDSHDAYYQFTYPPAFPNLGIKKVDATGQVQWESPVTFELSEVLSSFLEDDKLTVLVGDASQLKIYRFDNQGRLALRTVVALPFGVPDLVVQTTRVVADGRRGLVLMQSTHQSNPSASRSWLFRLDQNDHLDWYRSLPEEGLNPSGYLTLDARGFLLLNTATQYGFVRRSAAYLIEPYRGYVVGSFVGERQYVPAADPFGAWLYGTSSGAKYFLGNEGDLSTPIAHIFRIDN